MIEGFKPMLSANKGKDKGPVQLSDIKLPCYASVKLDGIRCLTDNGRVLTRKLIDVPNLHIRKLLSDPALHGLDGEIVCGEVTAPDCYLKTFSGAMTIEGEPEFTFWVFDRWDLHDLRFEDRLIELRRMELPPYVRVLEQEWFQFPEQLETFYVGLVEQGHEGIITKSANGRYKFGRSTVKENGMCKLKPREDSEAEILEFLELERNTNEAVIDERGYIKRSKAQAGMVAGGTLGRVKVRDIHHGWEFYLGGGKLFTDKVRQAIWDNQGAYRSAIIKYSYCPVGMKDVPRQPTADGWRAQEDM